MKTFMKKTLMKLVNGNMLRNLFKSRFIFRDILQVITLRLKHLYFPKSPNIYIILKGIRMNIIYTNCIPFHAVK